MTTRQHHLTLRDVANRYNTTPAVVLDFIEAGKLPAHRRKGRWVVDPADLDTYTRVLGAVRQGFVATKAAPAPKRSRRAR